MDSTIVKDVILDKKIDDYKANLDNYVAGHEITVTITLSEYRKLVETAATTKSAIDEANKDKWSRDEENKRLKEEIASLKAENYELQKSLGKITENEED